jgi:hypothetical protein
VPSLERVPESLAHDLLIAVTDHGDGFSDAAYFGTNATVASVRIRRRLPHGPGCP